LFRVHCAVLKVRAVPAPVRRLPRAAEGIGAVRRGSVPALRSSARSSRSLRTQQRAWAWRPPCRRFRTAPAGAAVLAGSRRPHADWSMFHP
jgi:hypothetical protein